MADSRPGAGATGTVHDHRFHLLQVRRVIRETPDTSSFVLDVPAHLQPAFAYQSGQFCSFRVEVDGQAHVRCYSMSSAPDVDAEFRVTVKRTPDGVVSNWMNDSLQAGDALEVMRPTGFFVLGSGSGDIVAFAAGSGITPVLSLMKTALHSTGRAVRLFYANRDAESVIFRAEIDALQARFGERLVVTHHLDVDRGLVEVAALGRFADIDERTDVYVCGPAPFMELVEQAMTARGVAGDRFHIERFTPPDPEPAPAATDPSAVGTTVTVELAGRTETTGHYPGTTLLQTARQMGLSPPYSCESGSCATCMAMMVQGAATMRVNNALTADEVAEGWILTCQAVPSGPSVHVVYDYEEG